MAELTPMMRQYLEIKSEHPDCIVFFRLGDFYEMFFEDAETASREMEIVLTGRDAGLEKRVPMCGIPFHAADNYITRLISKGYKVAICEQTEDAKNAKGLVKREVVRIVTPGTIFESNMLNEKENNFLVAVAKIGTNFGLAYADISTGALGVCETFSIDTIQNEIIRLAPKEVIIQALAYQESFQKLFVINNILCTVGDEYFKASSASESICSYFKVGSVEALGLTMGSSAILAVSALLRFLSETQKASNELFSKVKIFSPENYMILDSATRRNLELIQPLRSQNKNHALLGIIDETITAMGARLLRNWMQQPLVEKEKIITRLDAVTELHGNFFLRSEARDVLKGIYDLERIAGRVVFGNIAPRDLVALKNSLQNIVILQSALQDVASPLLTRLKACDPLHDIKELLQEAISENPPLSAKEEGIIKSGYRPEIDALRLAKTEGKNWIASLENKERVSTGIKSLKIGYNRVFGYYIEITHGKAANVPLEYIRKQTLANAERYITPELKEIEDKILGAEEKLLQLEYETFTAIRKKISESITRIQNLAISVAEVDVIQAFAECAVKNNYVKPVLVDENVLRIVGGRHPVVEKTLQEGFVSNDAFIDGEDASFMLLTGPNMAGKSTYMRQIALIVLLAQIGSYVPADEVQMGVVDRIFTRVGASDDLASGQSTFMVEMIETANILHHATPKSLVILDEIGRGTSTYDGVSIAWAVSEYLLNVNGSKSIFATHYHELTELTKYHAEVANFHVAVKEKGEEIIFIRKILPGATDRSYGIHVAKLAGLPHSVIQRAGELLLALEKKADIHIPEVHNQNLSKPKQVTIFGDDHPLHPILNEMSSLNIVNLTPLEALLKINLWQKKLKEGK